MALIIEVNKFGATTCTIKHINYGILTRTTFVLGNCEKCFSCGVVDKPCVCNQSNREKCFSCSVVAKPCVCNQSNYQLLKFNVGDLPANFVDPINLARICKAHVWEPLDRAPVNYFYEEKISPAQVDISYSKKFKEGDPYSTVEIEPFIATFPWVYFIVTKNPEKAAVFNVNGLEKLIRTAKRNKTDWLWNYHHSVSAIFTYWGKGVDKWTWSAVKHAEWIEIEISLLISYNILSQIKHSSILCNLDTHLRKSTKLERIFFQYNHVYLLSNLIRFCAIWKYYSEIAQNSNVTKEFVLHRDQMLATPLA